jgi:putative peptidoglycan lipid II flippase
MLMAGFLLAALLGAVRQVLFHAQFGASDEAIAFYAALRLPDVLFSLLAGGALSSALIPVLLKTAWEEGQAAAARLTTQVLTSLLVGFVLLVLLLEVCAPFFVRVALAPGFADSTSRLTITLTRLMLVQPLILVLSAVATAVLHSRNRFLLTALALLSHNLGLIVGILWTQLWPGPGIYGAALGVIGGALGQVAILLPGLADLRLPPWPRWHPLNRHLREVARLFIPKASRLWSITPALSWTPPLLRWRRSRGRWQPIITHGGSSRSQLLCWAKRWARQSCRSWLLTAMPVIGTACAAHCCGRWVLLAGGPFWS